MSGERFTLDTNILIYSIDAGAGPRHDVAAQVVQRAEDLACCLTLQAVSEFYAVVTQKGLLSRIQATEAARLWLDMFPIVCASAASARMALELAVARRASYWDALLVATAAEGKCSAILTEDLGNGANLAGVRIVNPFDNGQLSEAARLILNETDPAA